MTTNASRMVMIAGEKVACVEFGLRRAQGPNGAMMASKYSYLGGFVGSSNVYAGYLTGVPLVGTQAHSMIMSFSHIDDIEHCRNMDGVDLYEKCLEYREKLGWQNTVDGELYAFISFAFAYPTEFSSLVDSYNTLESGVKNFLIVSCVLDDLGYKAKGIRLDSGDLAELSKQTRKLF